MTKEFVKNYFVSPVAVWKNTLRKKKFFADIFFFFMETLKKFSNLEKETFSFCLILEFLTCKFCRDENGNRQEFHALTRIDQLINEVTHFVFFFF